MVEYARRLKLPNLAEHMGAILHEAQEKQPTYPEFLLACLEREVRDRERKITCAGSRRRGFPQGMT